MRVDYQAPLDLQPGQTITLSTELTVPSPYVFGHDILDHLAARLLLAAGADPIDKIFLISDPTVFALYGEAMERQLRATGVPVLTHLLPSGEQSKTFDHLQRLCEALMEQSVTKRSVLVAFGGGATGNVAGLVAGLMFRGIRFVEIPTTFTHLTDGTLSNKQAVNGTSGKNHFGMYHSPILIWGDTHYLVSESRRFRDAGLVEGIKNGLIDQPAFLDYLRSTLDPSGAYAPPILTELAYKTIRSKLEILKKDPTEKEYCIVLEYGHTFAHAIEWLSEGGLIHGEAVGIGMRIAARLAHALGLIPQEVVALHDEMINDRLGLTASMPAAATPAAVLKTMGVDNKKTGDVIRYCLLEDIGRCANPEHDYLMRVDDEQVLEVLTRFRSEQGWANAAPPAEASRLVQ